MVSHSYTKWLKLSRRSIPFLLHVCLGRFALLNSSYSQDCFAMSRLLSSLFGSGGVIGLSLTF